MNQLHAALDAGTDPRVLARQIVEYLRALLLIKLGNSGQANLPKETLKQASKHAGAFSSQQVLHMIREFNAAATDLRGGWQPALSLELASGRGDDKPRLKTRRRGILQSANRVVETTPATGKKENTSARKGKAHNLGM